MPAIAAATLPLARVARLRRHGLGLKAVALVAVVLPGVAGAGVAFRCTTADGAITLTDQPCGRDARESKTYKTLDATTTERAASPKRHRGAGGEGGSADPAAPVGAPTAGRPVVTRMEDAARVLPGVRPVGAVSNRGNQKIPICAALAEERELAQKQIRGEAVPQAGENPRDNLALIDRQWTRVGCAGVATSG